MAEIFEDVKDMGVLIGKGGVYGQVTTVSDLSNLSQKFFCSFLARLISNKKNANDQLQELKNNV